jgi:hypothetical protein
MTSVFHSLQLFLSFSERGLSVIMIFASESEQLVSGAFRSNLR